MRSGSAWRTVPGTPITSEYSGTSWRGGTSAPAATIEFAPITACGSSVELFPRSTPSPISRQWITAACPIVTSSPMVSGSSQWITTLSCTLTSLPSRIGA